RGATRLSDRLGRPWRLRQRDERENLALDPRRTPISPRLQGRTRPPRRPREGPSPGNRSGTHSSSPVRNPGLPSTESGSHPPPIRPVPLRPHLEEDAAPTRLAPTGGRIGQI